MFGIQGLPDLNLQSSGAKTKIQIQVNMEGKFDVFNCPATLIPMLSFKDNQKQILKDEKKLLLIFKCFLLHLTAISTLGKKVILLVKKVTPEFVI